MTIKVPLHAVAHGRAGDKGNRSSISVIPFYSDAYKHIVFQITEDIVFQLFRHKGATAVRRYELPKLPALNFVIDDALEGGVNGSLSVDSHGKTLSFFLSLGTCVCFNPLAERKHYFFSRSAPAYA